MLETIKKRDGRVVPFDLKRIEGAITKAFLAVNPDLSLSDRTSIATVTSAVNSALQEEAKNTPDYVPEVEHVQDLVETALVRAQLDQVAKNYILYRNERTRVRDMNSRINKTYQEITWADSKESNMKRDNANINGDTAMGSMLKYGTEGSKHFYEQYVLKPEHSQAHREGDIHIHDLDFYTLTMTCCQIDIKKLFAGGFSTGHGYLREPNDIASYSALACIAIQSNQNDQHGGQAIVNFDYGMADGVKKTFRKFYSSNLAKIIDIAAVRDDLSYEELLDKMNEIRKGIWDNMAASPCLDEAECEVYMRLERPHLKKFVSYLEKLSDEEVERFQRRAVEFTVKETDNKTFQAMEAFIHNMNTMHSRAGAQTPFSSINYGMDTSPEGRMVIKNLLLTTMQGLGNGETPIFPIQIFRVKEGVNFNEGEPNYDLFKLACKCSSKRLFPNFAFIDAPFNLQYYDPANPATEIAYMGCRTRIIGNVYDPTREICNQRGNLSFTSINLPRLAIRAHGDVDAFFKSLDEMLDLVFDQLYERFEIQARKKVYNFPFLMGQGVWLDSEKLQWNDEVREVIKHGSLGTGFIGLAETLVALTGHHHAEDPACQELGLKIITHMRKRCDDKAAETGLNYTLLATPAEGLSGRFTKIDKKLFGEIPGVTDREYYTNSFHVPVYYPINAFEKIRLEAPYHALTNGGHITYIEMDGDPGQNLEAFEKTIRCMKEAGIGYGSVNHPVDRDPICGYTGIIKDECPGCGRGEHDGPIGFERIRRITGYLVGTMDKWNDAKRAEEHDRVKHNIQ